MKANMAPFLCMQKLNKKSYCLLKTSNFRVQIPCAISQERNYNVQNTTTTYNLVW
jgi:hypothetical protein